jgi:hypothetical protein
MRDYADILEVIAEALSPDDIIDRLGISSEDLCDRLADDIANKLGEFEDVYSAGEYDDAL